MAKGGGWIDFRRITSQIELAIGAIQIGFYTSPHDSALLQTQLPQTLVPENNFHWSVMKVLSKHCGITCIIGYILQLQIAYMGCQYWKLIPQELLYHPRHKGSYRSEGVDVIKLSQTQSHKQKKWKRERTIWPNLTHPSIPPSFLEGQMEYSAARSLISSPWQQNSYLKSVRNLVSRPNV